LIFLEWFLLWVLLILASREQWPGSHTTSRRNIKLSNELMTSSPLDPITKPNDMLRFWIRNMVDGRSWLKRWMI
jgi:hypothetical protein